MWFRSKRVNRDPAVRCGVAVAPRRSPKFGPRFVEALEDRALMSSDMKMMSPPDHAPSAQFFKQTNLVSDGAVPETIIDPNLVNPWGIASSPTSPFWVADNGTGLATLYNGAGTPQSLVVTIPPPHGQTGPAAPTGTVFNSDKNPNDFVVTANGKSGASVFIFATEDGTISGWNPGVSSNGSSPSNQAILAVDNSASGAVYKGLAMAKSGGANYLYATNFHAGTIDVFDSTFKTHTFFTGQFTDPSVPPPKPGVPGYAPFGIQLIGNKLFVTYALQDEVQHDDVAGAGHGFIDEFDTRGHFIKRFATGSDLVKKGGLDELDSPWGLTLAPAGFFSGGQDHGEEGRDHENSGQSSHVLLVGNFGDSHVNEFDSRTGKFLGQLTGKDGKPLVLNGGVQSQIGLWGLRFGNGKDAGDPNTLFFTAGINDEADGLFGSVTPATN